MLTEISDDVTASLQSEAEQSEDEIVFTSDVKICEVDDEIEFQVI